MLKKMEVLSLLVLPNVSELSSNATWQMNMRSPETMEPGPYPERPGEPDCSYYIRTGLCRFGATCRFNHPSNRKLAIANARMKGEYPERPGQPECQYYLKTGTCKFGATCKFHHPKDKAGIAGRVSLNILGYPLRPNEVECAYYLRTGQCKFGSTCKFHHRQPSNMMVPLRGSVYASVQSPTAIGQQSYGGGVAGWSRASFIPSPRWQGPSSYAPVILPQGMVSVPGWNTYNSQLASVSSSENLLQTAGNSQVYGTTRQSDLVNIGSHGAFSPDYSGSLSVGSSAMQRENVFPERPGQPECQFYMKTGDCKFGAVCRFHHPRERIIPPPDCALSPMGLPLRPGEPLCIFYSRYGICKFGPSCKFDHPMGIFTYNLSASSLADPAAQHFPKLSTEGLVGKTRRLSLSETRQMPSSEDDIDTEE
ncbi:zinc finger CCCH domain-containing protein ZFN-like isoform X2 [Punica granatum]|uniref:Zinc finger CCCH domain-containing protein ZFN-like isoform X2 n=1 Tax=Punica granatum TaxID=22663 RepID=A0A6P8C5F9_PUNGR|nr:zinc finger CCCH domain-containing protein ZFN-like isoform X2 [Punica granatum]